MVYQGTTVYRGYICTAGENFLKDETYFREEQYNQSAPSNTPEC